jgi:TnpA family transposase
LNIEEHYTDTAGYTDQIFGLTHLLGFRFAPRLRDLADSKLYTIGKSNAFPKIEKLFRSQINTKIIAENYDDVLRLAHSVKEGTVSASLIIWKAWFIFSPKQFINRAAGNGPHRKNHLHAGLYFK